MLNFKELKQMLGRSNRQEKRVESATKKENSLPDCPVRNILARISGKWSLLVLLALADGGAVRFKALQRAIPDISQKMLASTLRTLVEDGYVSREVFAEVPPRVEYSLTERGRSLLLQINSLVSWAEENMAGIIADRNSAGL